MVSSDLIDSTSISEVPLFDRISTTTSSDRLKEMTPDSDEIRSETLPNGCVILLQLARARGFRDASVLGSRSVRGFCYL